jgi:DNA-directed RNA polymerase subunit F
MEKVRAERAITIAEARTLLQASEAELDQFQRRTRDYTDKFSKLEAQRPGNLWAS